MQGFPGSSSRSSENNFWDGRRIPENSVRNLRVPVSAGRGQIQEAVASSKL